MHIAERFFGRSVKRSGKPRAAAIALLLAASITGMTLTGAAVVQAHDPPPHRFFGFADDVTIDGEPIAAGVAIVAMIEGEAVSKATVSTAGSWYIDVSQADLAERPCNVSLTFDGLSSEQEWDSCPTRVTLDLVSAAEHDPLESEAAERIEEPSDEELVMQTDDSVSASADATELVMQTDDSVSASADATELVMQTDDSVSASADATESVMQTDDSVSASADATESVMPGTGSGGLLRDESSRPSAAAITGILMFAVVAVALLIGRRTDGAR